MGGRMKIKSKITLFTSFFLVLVVVLNTFFSLQNIQKHSEQRLQTFRNESIADVKKQLKDLVSIAYETIDKNYSNLNDLKFLSKYYERRLHNTLNSGENIINRYRRMIKNGQITLDEAKKRAKEEIRVLRFAGGTDYLWINDIGEPYPRMIMHPTIPELEGQVLSSEKFNNALGIKKNLFSAFVEVTRNSNEGYVDYLWPKPTKKGLTDEVQKLSYVRRYNDWGWILGTGIYIDDAHEEIMENIKQTVKKMRYADGTGYFWINDNTLPYPTMVMHPTVPKLDGRVLDNSRYNSALGTNKNLFQAFAEITARDSEGYVDYLWPKPTKDGLTDKIDKISFVKLHKPTGWIIGTGAYLDTIDEAIEKKRSDIEQQKNDMIFSNIISSAIFIAIAIGVSVLFSNSMANPIKRLTNVADLISKGRDLSADIDEVNRTDEIGELAKSIDRLKTSVKIMIGRMSK
jgi:methyl-accepting chemotaxis protein